MLSATALAFIGLATSLLVAFGQWVDPANTKTPWSWSATSRATLFFVASALVGVGNAFADAQPGSSAMSILVVAIPTFLFSMLAHFGHSGRAAAAAGAVVFVLLAGSAQTACTPAQAANDVQVGLQIADDVCVIGALLDAYTEQASPPAAQDIRTACKIEAALEPEVEKLVQAFENTPAARKQTLARSRRSGFVVTRTQLAL